MSTQKDKIEIIYEDKNLLVINKPASLLVHQEKISQPKAWAQGPSASDRGRLRTEKIYEFTLVDWLRKKYPEIKDVGDDPENRPGIVHRLDKNTSGVLVVAKNQKTFLFFKEQFQKRKVKKIYWTLVHGTPKEKRGIISKAIAFGKKRVLKRTLSIFGKPAETKYKVLKNFGTFSLIEAQPLTGRTHQIRLHLKSIGHPIVGDPLYKFKRQRDPWGIKRQFLHAYSITLQTPEGKEKTFTAPLPPELQKIMETLDS